MDFFKEGQSIILDKVLCISDIQARFISPGHLIKFVVLNDAPALSSELNINLPAELERIIARALAKSLQERYQNISEIIIGLQATENSRYEAGQFADLPK